MATNRRIEEKREGKLHEAAANTKIVILQVEYYESCATKEALPCLKKQRVCTKVGITNRLCELPFTCVDQSESPCSLRAKQFIWIAFIFMQTKLAFIEKFWTGTRLETETHDKSEITYLD